MTEKFDDYQFGAQATAVYPEDRAIEYLALGLVSEAGEVAGKVKKIIRDGGGFNGVDHRRAMRDEIGDVLWYVAMLCDEYGLDMSEVAQNNLEKLASRQQRGVIGGNGDNR